MWMNLDQLPAGKAMFTVYVTVDPEGTNRSAMSAEEVDVVASRSASWGEVVNDGGVHPRGERCVDYLLESYGPDSRVIGVTNESDGYVVYDAFKAGDETGEDDL